MASALGPCRSGLGAARALASRRWGQFPHFAQGLMVTRASGSGASGSGLGLGPRARRSGSALGLGARARRSGPDPGLAHLDQRAGDGESVHLPPPSGLIMP